MTSWIHRSVSMDKYVRRRGEWSRGRRRWQEDKVGLESAAACRISVSTSDHRIGGMCCPPASVRMCYSLHLARYSRRVLSTWRAIPKASQSDNRAKDSLCSPLSSTILPSARKNSARYYLITVMARSHVGFLVLQLDL
jgi:hypothetical protein